MQQRRQQPGNIVDDYCPRERRITDHAIVAMVDDDVQRTRCVVCDAEHQFKAARIPPQRKKKSTAALFSQVLDGFETPGRIATPSSEGETPDLGESPAETPGDTPVPADGAPPQAAADPPQPDEGGFRRSLIRAQLPRQEGQTPPPRAIPEFTMHQPLHPRGRHGGHRSGAGHPRRGAGNDSTFGPMRSGHGQPGHGADRPPGGRRRRRGRKNR